MIGLAQKLAEIERLIEHLRWARDQKDAPERQTYIILKEIAGDLRGRQCGKPGKARAAIEREIANAKRSKTRLGYEIGSLRAVAEAAIGNWPTISQALERFEHVLQQGE